MIVWSGTLVLVALVLLGVGLAMTTLTFVYASIAISALACLVLLPGAVRRHPTATTPPPDDGPPGGASGVAVDEPEDAAVRSRSARPPDLPQVSPAEDDDLDVDALGIDGSVLVVPGRPRYHVDGCRQLEGQPVRVGLRAAREEGFTPCGDCTPHVVLAGRLLEDEDATDPTTPDDTAQARADRADLSAAAAASASVDDGPPGGSDRSTTVVVIPDRGRYHRPDCRFARGLAGVERMGRDQARREGYDACGSCSP